jgi:6-phosphogluconolactonase
MRFAHALVLALGSSSAAIFAACSAADDLAASTRVTVDAGRQRVGGSAAARADGSSPSSPSDGSASAPLFLFVGSYDGNIRVYDVDAATGALTFKQMTSAGTNPSFLAFDPSRRRVVAVDETDTGKVRSFAFDPSSGALTSIAVKDVGAGPTFLSIDPSGSWVFVARYTAGTMSVLSLDPTGALAVADDENSGAKSHWAGTNPSGNYVFVPALGANTVSQYSLNHTTGKLSDNGVISLPANSGPRHLAFLPNETHAYLINETAVSITAFDFDRTTGKLSAREAVSALPPGQTKSDTVTGAEIAVHPSGAHLYASTRGYDAIAHFTIHPDDGALTFVESTPTGGDQPRSFGLSPEGTLLYAGNQDVGQLVGYRIVAATGALEPLGDPVNVPTPMFVGLVRMP